MYKIEFHKEVDNDFKELGNNISLLVFKKLHQLAKNPIVGEDLGNKANINLAGFKKVYVNNKRVRIVYKIIEDKIEVFVIAVGKRDDMEVYKKARSRT